jgi:hypothetical protein
MLNRYVHDQVRLIDVIAGNNHSSFICCILCQSKIDWKTSNFLNNSIHDTPDHFEPHYQRNRSTSESLVQILFPVNKSFMIFCQSFRSMKIFLPVKILDCPSVRHLNSSLMAYEMFLFYRESIYRSSSANNNENLSQI